MQEKRMTECMFASLRVCVGGGGEFVNPCVCWCVICVCVCVCVAEQPAWRVSGILGSKRERKGERKERKDAPPVEL